MIAVWQRWVRFWAAQETGEPLAVVRLCLGLVVLADFLEIWRLDLVVETFGVQGAGGG